MNEGIRRRLDEAAHRYRHGEPAECVTPEQAEELRERGGMPIVCLWGEGFGRNEADGLAAALAAAGLRVLIDDPARREEAKANG